MNSNGNEISASLFIVTAEFQGVRQILVKVGKAKTRLVHDGAFSRPYASRYSSTDSAKRAIRKFLPRAYAGQISVKEA